MTLKEHEAKLAWLQREGMAAEATVAEARARDEAAPCLAYAEELRIAEAVAREYYIRWHHETIVIQRLRTRQANKRAEEKE